MIKWNNAVKETFCFKWKQSEKKDIYNLERKTFALYERKF